MVLVNTPPAPTAVRSPTDPGGHLPVAAYGDQGLRRHRRATATINALRGISTDVLAP